MFVGLKRALTPDIHKSEKIVLAGTWDVASKPSGTVEPLHESRLMLLHVRGSWVLVAIGACRALHHLEQVNALHATPTEGTAHSSCKVAEAPAPRHIRTQSLVIFTWQSCCSALAQEKKPPFVAEVRQVGEASCRLN